MTTAESVAARFYKYVSKSDNCWEWTGGMYKCGYGQFYVRTHGNHSERKGYKRYAHRMAWELSNGPIPAGMYVCHRCDNPKCVRLDHLFVGTPRENYQDCKAKGRVVIYSRRGRLNGKAKLTAAQAAEIKAAPQAYGNVKAMAGHYGVSRDTIQRIRNGSAYANVL